MISLLSYDAAKRPTLSQIRQHPWMQKSYNKEAARQALLRHLAQTQPSKPEQAPQPQAKPQMQKPQQVLSARK
jgi:hypothetical protein